MNLNEDGDDVARGRNKSYTIIVAAANIDEVELLAIVCAAADGIAAQIDTSQHVPWDVDVIEGTYADPLNGDNVHGLGRHETEGT